MKEPLFLIAESTNEDEYIDFLKQLKVQVKSEYAYKSPKPIILLDNHSAHKTERANKEL